MATHVFLVQKRTFVDQDDALTGEGALEAESVHAALGSANAHTEELFLTMEEERSLTETEDKTRNDPKWGKLFGGLVVALDREQPFAVSFCVYPMPLTAEIPTAAQIKDPSLIKDFSGMNFSFVGELETSEIEQLRWMVVDKGGKWKPIEYFEEPKSLYGLDFVVTGRNVSKAHRDLIEANTYAVVNHQGLERIAARSTTPKNQHDIHFNPLQCLSGLNFQALGARVDHRFRSYGTARRFGGSIPSNYGHISQIDYIIRPDGNETEALNWFENQCQEKLKIQKPTVITVQEFARIILKRCEGHVNPENPACEIKVENLDNWQGCLKSLSFSVMGCSETEEAEVQTRIKSNSGKLLENSYRADYFVKGS